MLDADERAQAQSQQLEINALAETSLVLLKTTLDNLNSISIGKNSDISPITMCIIISETEFLTNDNNL